MFQQFPRIDYYVSVATEEVQFEKLIEEINEIEYDIRVTQDPDRIASEIMDLLQAGVTRLYRMADDGDIDLEEIIGNHLSKMQERQELIDWNASFGIIGDGRTKY